MHQILRQNLSPEGIDIVTAGASCVGNLELIFQINYIFPEAQGIH